VSDPRERRPLWAPWRIEYITGPKSEGCIFCEAAASSPASDEEHHVLERGERCLTMMNAFPYAPGHLMVAPVRHVGKFEDVTDAEMAEMMKLAQRAVAAMRDAMSPDGFNLGLNLGSVAGAGIADHLHLHAVPRWSGDTNFMPMLAGTHVISQALDAAREVLLEALRQLG
jgi:ATP adenylyltransferase